MSFGTFWGTDPTDPATYEKILDRYLPTTALGVQSVNVAAPIVNTGTPQNPVIAAGFANAGDLLVGTGANTGAVLGIAGAAAGDYLRVNAGVNGIEWSAGAGAVPALSAVLAVGNDGNAAGITNAGNIGCADIQAPFGSINSFNSTTIQDIGGTGLAVIPVGTLHLKGCQTKGSILAGNGATSVEVPIGAAPNGYVLTADSAAAAGVSWEENGKVSTVQAGNNISVDVSAPYQPVVALKNPLDAQLNIADVAVSGTSTDGVSKTNTLTAQVVGGVGQYRTDYNDTATGDTAFAYINVDANAGLHSESAVSWTDAVQTSTASVITKTQLNQSDIQLATANTTSGYNTTRGIVVLDGASIDTTTSNQPSASIIASRIEQTGAAIGVNNYLQMTQGSTNSYNTMNVNLNSSSTDLNYTFASGGTTQQFLIENDAGTGTGARIRFQHNETGGVGTVAHRQTIQVSNANPSLSQSYQNTLVNPNPITTTLTTTGSGGALSCDNFLNINGLTTTLSGTGNTIVQSTSGTVVINAQNNTTTISATTGGGSTASHVLDNGVQTFSTNKATNPQFVFQNTTTSVSQYPSIKIDRPNVASTAGNTIGAIGFFADNAASNTFEFGRIQTKSENVGAGNEDGTISIFGLSNGLLSEVFNYNGGSTNEMNSFRPLDMNNNAVRTSTGDLTIDTSASSGNGILTLATKNGTGGLVITGDKTQSATAGGSAGTHLVITLNGNVYKIALLNP